MIESEQSEARPCVFRKVHYEEVEVVVVVVVGDILAHDKTPSPPEGLSVLRRRHENHC